MTLDQRLFEKMKREGECWHKADRMSHFDRCVWCNSAHIYNPDFTTPEGFFWLWERTQEKEWWEDFRKFFCKDKIRGIYLEHIQSELFPTTYVNPLKFRAALMEFWGIKENPNDT